MIYFVQDVQDDSEMEDYSAPEVGHLVLPERVPLQVGVPQGDAPGASIRQDENLHHNLNHNLASGIIICLVIFSVAKLLYNYNVPVYVRLFERFVGKRDFLGSHSR